jgi:hypothetical protein
MILLAFGPDGVGGADQERGDARNCVARLEAQRA